MKIRHILLVGLGLAVWPTADARAEFWTAIDTVPKPNAIIALDASVTMGIDMGACGGGGSHSCHRFDPHHPNTRLNRVKEDLLATLPSFQEYFAFGGFRYHGCNRARAFGHVYPDNTNLASSYNDTRSMIENTLHCGFSERRYPDGSPPTAGCLTPACAREEQVLRDIANRGVTGLNITPPLLYDVNVTCDVPGAPRPFINLQAMLLTQLGAGGFHWPSWGSTPDLLTVQADLCDPLQTELEAIRTDIQACTSTPTDVWDMSFLSGGWCNAGQVASTVCDSGQPLDNTCVCRPDRASCRTGPVPRSDCGHMYTWKARQQLGVCETFSPNAFGQFFTSHSTQQDNIARGPGVVGFCRENVAMIMTDGAFGSTPGVVLEAYHAQPFYESADRLSNMFVFHISTAFTDAANAMMNEVSAGLHTTAFRATDPVQMRESFAKVLSRTYKGVYTGSSLTLDELGRRAYFHSFTVPGYSPSSPVSHEYLGMPSRISVHRVRDDGYIEHRPLFESDERSRVLASPGCGPVNVPASLMSDIAIPPSTRHVDLIGPDETFSNGTARGVSLPANSVDRDGDGAADNHPPLQYGRSFGFAQSAPLIVDAPKDVAIGEGSTSAEVLNFMAATRGRPRIIYYQANGYVLGLHGGDYRAFASPQTFGKRTFTYDYNDNVGHAGSEVFRYRPSWLTESDVRYTYEFNNVVQQPLMTGELIARELYLDPDYRTILLGNQGKEGRGYFAVDITDPCSPPTVVAEWTLPAGSYASGEPNVHLFPMPSTPVKRNVLITSSGLDATNNEIYAFDIRNGSMLARAALPARAGHSYPTAPVCVDTSGEGVVTHCYALRSDGYVARVAVRPGGFLPYVDVTPQNAGGSVVTMAPNRFFFTRPVAFFDADGAVSLVFGSGDYRRLTQPSGTNYVFKIRDENTRRVGVPSGPTSVAQVCQADGAGNTEGVFRLGPGERLISSPIIENGVVAWTTYVSRTTGCVSGDGYHYAMDFQTCADAQTGGSRPVRRAIGPGLPTTPTLHAQSERFLVNTSAGPSAVDVVRTQEQNTQGGGRPFVKRLYWRLELNSQ